MSEPREALRRIKMRAEKALAKGELEDALTLFKKVVKGDSLDVGCSMKIADICRQLGNPSEAIAVYVGVARLYATDGLSLRAVAVCKKILAIDPGHVATREMLSGLSVKRTMSPRAAVREDREAGRAAAVPPAVAKPTAVMGAWPTALGSASSTTLAPMDAKLAPLEPMTVRAPIMGAWPVGPGVSTASAGERVTRSAASLVSPMDPDVSTAQAASTVTPQETTPAGVTKGPAILRSWPKAMVPTTSLGAIASSSGSGPEASVSSEGQGRALPERMRWIVGAWPDVEGRDEIADVPPNDSPGSQETSSSGSEEGATRWVLPRIPLFSDLPQSAMLEVVAEMRLVDLRPGDYVIREGELGDAFFVLVSGRVRVVRRGSENEELLLAHLGEGAFFGEMALLQDGPRSASVIVEEAGQVFEVKRALLERIVDAYPSVGRVLRDFSIRRLLSATLATHPFFGPLSPEDRHALMGKFTSRLLAKGDTLLHQGSRGEGLYIVLTGVLKVTRLEDGAGLPVAMLKTGDLCGEMSLLLDRPTVATVTAVEAGLVLRLDKGDFDSLVANHPEVRSLVASISQARELENLTLPNRIPAAACEDAMLV